MPLSSGTKLGPYEIQSPLGAGGMGEVYRARDTRLERTVAIKILPPQVSNDPLRKQRFEREAKTISNLNHPHICVLHDVGHHDGIEYLVMECVEGETLAKRLEKGPLSLEQVLRYGAQIADALDKAHRNGIVHRDLKPGNIMLTATGAKLLDFGLAKPTGEPIAAPLTAATATLAHSSPVTEAGMIVGTFHYMSPEQVEGKDVDGRSDIFSLGAVLYEMLTGKRAFDGKSQLSVASAILEKEPDPITATKSVTPPALDHAIRRCLAKNPDDRWQTARDVALELKWIAEGGSGQFTAPAIATASARSARANVPWIVAAALAVLLVAAVLWFRGSNPPKQMMYFSAPFSFEARDLSVAPNGHTLAVVGYDESARKNAIWVYELGAPQARRLPDTEDATYPFWSPDGTSLGFFADGKLKRLEVGGGPPQTLADAPSGRGGTWNKDGVIIFTPQGRFQGLMRIPASGGTPVQISSPDPQHHENTHRWPQFLPDGKHYLYLATDIGGMSSDNAVYVGALDSTERKKIINSGGNSTYVAPGYLLYMRIQDRSLIAQPFDINKLELTGEPKAVLTGVEYLPRIARAFYSSSDSGLLVAQTGGGAATSELVWFDRNGNEAGVVGKPDFYANVTIAPDGKSVAVEKTNVENQNANVWIYDLQRGMGRRLTFNSAIDATPVWSHDSSKVMFSSSRPEAFNLYIKNADGAQDETKLLEEPKDKLIDDWSRDGKNVLYTRVSELWTATYPDMNRRLFLKAPGVQKTAQFSPDGRWIAYASNETGKWEIYVTSFPDAHGRWEISSGGGEQPRWRADGKELFYLSPDATMMAVPVKIGSSFDAGPPIVLFQANPRELVATTELTSYDVSRDGQRFLINTQINSAAQPMTFILNWSAFLSPK